MFYRTPFFGKINHENQRIHWRSKFLITIQATFWKSDKTNAYELNVTTQEITTLLI